MSKAIKIKELSKYINNLVKRDPILANLHVEGEVSNFKISSGNVYFVLKDEGAALRCIIFKNMGLAKTISIKDGMKVVARGSLTTYDYGSYYQLLVKEIVSDGIGDIYKEFEILKSKLLEEGYFDEKHKKKIPFIPNSIGVITSQTGAAIRDIINTIKRRFPITDIYIYPAKVQGADAPAMLIEGLKYFDSVQKVDTIIIGRGGGSFEDLNSFNEEQLLYEIYNTKTPVISAVGHEVDNMLSDFVADLRAATPTAAAELSTPVLEDLKLDLKLKKEKLDKSFDNYIVEEKKILDYYFKELNYYNPKERINTLSKELTLIKENLDKLFTTYFSNKKHELDKKYLNLRSYNPINRIKTEEDKLIVNKKLLNLKFNNFIGNEKYKLDGILSKLERFNPKNILKQGYVKVSKDNKDIKSIKDLDVDEKIKLFFVDGIASATITEKENKFE
ncbi:exodeoxyribonuclease VII large subunit [Miniphocaeibacter massiliensis]|uniref:exodeoxyribonuclease VII large subunit n=1 Tax=Miniphocaeibacter massiliensis TaxID=2041841 RepID=UPI000C06B603|nr:exodeoxyribonuclease VII large subunit [Miniphocaeibacter massiliensis]